MGEAKVRPRALAVLFTNTERRRSTRLWRRRRGKRGGEGADVM